MDFEKNRREVLQQLSKTRQSKNAYSKQKLITRFSKNKKSSHTVNAYSTRGFFMELWGLEPQTPTLPALCSPS